MNTAVKPPLNTHSINDDLVGAIYLVVGQGTEGGTSSYRLSIAGLTFKGEEIGWGNADRVAANSGYSIGAIQLDLGQRGTWPVGATSGRAVQAGERSYVDAIIETAADYAKTNNLPFTQDHQQLRSDLLSRGKGRLQFIDENTRDSINAWAGSDEGKQWIHQNVDLPQARNMTQKALETLNTHGKNFKEEERFEALCMIAKTANQLPAMMNGNRRVPTGMKDVLQNGGDYADLLAHANHIKKNTRYDYFDANKAGELGRKYEEALSNPETAAQLRSAQQKVSSSNYSPATQGQDSDVREALIVVGAQRANRVGIPAEKVGEIQASLVELGFTGKNGKPLVVDKHWGPNTEHALKTFQEAHGLQDNGIPDQKTLDALEKAKSQRLDNQAEFESTKSEASRLLDEDIHAYLDGILAAGQSGDNAKFRAFTQAAAETEFAKNFQEQVVAEVDQKEQERIAETQAAEQTKVAENNEQQQQQGRIMRG